MQAANLSFQASGFGCSPGRDAFLYFAEAPTLTFTVDLIALEESNIIRHNKFVTVLATITSTLLLLMIYLARSHSGKLPSSLLTLPVTAPEHGFKEVNEINAHYVGI